MIFHYASAVTRSFCFVLVVNCLHGLGFSHNAVFVFTHTNLTDLTNLLPSLFFVSRESRESHEMGCIAEGSQLANSPSVSRGSTAEPGGSYKRSA